MSGAVLAESHSEYLIFIAEELEALEKSVYVNIHSRTAHIDKEKALGYYNFTDEELQSIQVVLDNLTDEQIQVMIDNSQIPSEDGMQAKVAPIIIWGGIAALGIFSGTALYFSSKYMNYKEKQNLVNRCYDVGGTPVIESGDTGGIHMVLLKKHGGKFLILTRLNVLNK